MKMKVARFLLVPVFLAACGSGGIHPTTGTPDATVTDAPGVPLVDAPLSAPVDGAGRAEVAGPADVAGWTGVPCGTVPSAGYCVTGAYDCSMGGGVYTAASCPTNTRCCCYGTESCIPAPVPDARPQFDAAGSGQPCHDAYGDTGTCLDNNDSCPGNYIVDGACPTMTYCCLGQVGDACHYDEGNSHFDYGTCIHINSSCTGAIEHTCGDSSSPNVCCVGQVGDKCWYDEGDGLLHYGICIDAGSTCATGLIENTCASAGTQCCLNPGG